MKRPKPRKGGTKSSVPPGPTREESFHHYNEGIQFFQRGQLALAASAFRKALSLNPEFPEAHNNLGNALIGLGKWKTAESSFRHALRFHPGNAYLTHELVGKMALGINPDETPRWG